MDQTEIELKITELMQKLQQNSLSLEKIGCPFMSIVEENMKKYEDAIKPYSEESTKIQNEIKFLMLLRQKSLKTGSGNITFKKGGIRRKWDLDALDETCNKNESIKQNIWKFRKEEPFEPQVIIKVNVEGTSVTEI